MTIQGLAIDTDVEESVTDTLGGGSYIKSTGLYPVTVDMAYLSKTVNGALALNLHFKAVEDNSMIRQTIYMTSGDKKGNKNHYFDKNKKKRLLPGMITADQIATITAGKSMAALTPEQKTIKLWDYESQAEKPTQVPVLTEILGQPLLVGLHKIRDNKVIKDSNNKYIRQAAEKFLNEMDKVFYPDGFSVTEKTAEAAEALFHHKWQDKFGPDYVNDKYVEIESEEDDDEDALPSAESTASLFG